MEINSTGLLKLLREVDRVRQETLLAARLTGEHFNVFNILGLTTDEVRTHSAFIAELLNPRGSHGQGTLYLDLFLKCISSDDNPLFFDSSEATIQVEHPIGEINIENSTGGRVDILLTDSKNGHIVIENKINAGDQDGQLLRYHNAFPDAFIYYLTLNGGRPHEKSIGTGNFEFSCISYKDHISGWLENCYKESVAFPVVRETIKQYKTLIDNLTNQAIGGKVKEKAIRLILDNPMLADAIDLLSDAWQTVVERVESRFWKEASRVKGHIAVAEGISVFYSMPNDCGGVVIAFRLDVKSNIPSDSAKKYMYLKDILPSIVSAISAGEPKKYSKSTFWNMGWFNAKGFGPNTYLSSLPKERLLEYYQNEGSLVCLINDISEQAENVLQKLQQTLQAKQDGEPR